MKILLIVFGCVALVGLAIALHQDAMTAPAAPPATKQLKAENLVRRMAVKQVENNLLEAGFDVQVTFIDEDDSQMLIVGECVNRPFAHNLMARRDFRKMLRSDKFTRVTFFDSMTFPHFSQDYAVN